MDETHHYISAIIAALKVFATGCANFLCVGWQNYMTMFYAITFILAFSNNVTNFEIAKYLAQFSTKMCKDNYSRISIFYYDIRSC